MRPIALVAFVLMLPGCAELARQQALRQALIEEARQPVVCQKGTDCEYRWGRAVQWVNANSHWKIRTATDFMLSTEGPFDTMWPAYTVQKIPQSDGSYWIAMEAGCGNMFACSPDPWDAVLDFRRFVSAGVSPGSEAATVK